MRANITYNTRGFEAKLIDGKQTQYMLIHYRREMTREQSEKYAFPCASRMFGDSLGNVQFGPIA